MQVSSNTGPSVLHSIPFPTGPPNCQSCTTPNQHSRAAEPSCKTRSERRRQKKSHCGSLQLQSSPCPCPHTSAATRGVVTDLPSHPSACSVEMRPAVLSAWSPSRTQPRLLRPRWKTREGQQDGAAGLWCPGRQPEQGRGQKPRSTGPPAPLSAPAQQGRRQQHISALHNSTAHRENWLTHSTRTDGMHPHSEKLV